MKVLMIAVAGSMLWLGSQSAWAGHGTSWSIQIGSPVRVAPRACAPSVVYVQPACAPAVYYPSVVYRSHAPARHYRTGYVVYEPIGWGRYQPVRPHEHPGRPIQRYGCR